VVANQDVNDCSPEDWAVDIVFHTDLFNDLSPAQCLKLIQLVYEDPDLRQEMQYAMDHLL
jgi:hypothetical protein